MHDVQRGRVVFRKWRRRSVVLGPVPLPEGDLELRAPRLRDGRAWSSARLANREWLERAFPAWGDDWADEQSVVAWVERWWYLRRASRRVGARPFVVWFDGKLVGELGVDAVDPLTNSGEASVWLVRDHGSASVMNTASLLLIDHCFQGPDAFDRLISPVATTSRPGRAPGLTAAGLWIEATVPRSIGPGPLVDHDIWVLHNTGPVRERVRRSLAASSRTGDVGADPARVNVSDPPVADRAVTMYAVARVAVRRTRNTFRMSVARLRTSRSNSLGTRLVSARPISVDGNGAIWSGSTRVGAFDLRYDSGTRTFEVLPDFAPGLTAEVLGAGVTIVMDAQHRLAPHARIVDVRIPLDRCPVQRQLEAVLTETGLTLSSSHPANPEGACDWPGEQRWSKVLA